MEPYNDMPLGDNMDEYQFEWGIPYAEGWGLVKDKMIQDHWAEVGSFQGLIPFEPDHAQYFRMEKAKALHILAVWKGERLVGYFILLIVPYPRSKNVLVAKDDVLYVAPDCRGDGLGVRIFAEAERYAQSKGVKIIMFRHKAWRTNPAYMKRLGFEPMEVVYAKVLKAPGDRNVRT